MRGSFEVSHRQVISSVIRFYETHPINEQQIVRNLEADGAHSKTEDVLQDYDQDLFGGLEQLEILREKAGIGRDSYVLDVCSGVGGPARHLASRYGCRVTGLDITESRHLAAQSLTRLVRLKHLVVSVSATPRDAVCVRNIRCGAVALHHLGDNLVTQRYAVRVHSLVTKLTIGAFQICPIPRCPSM
jgi:SAM-dependent methyltransferase